MENDTMRGELLRVLGAGARLTHAGKCYDVIFDNQYVLAGEVEERSPVATMRSSEVECAKLRKEAVVQVFNPFDDSTKSYRVKRLEPDGTGMTLVIMGADS
jgi:hypothetical protein